jgi:hypothetical protein
MHVLGVFCPCDLFQVFAYCEGSRRDTLQTTFENILESFVQISTPVGLHSVMEYDPMLLESRLPYPETLDKTVLDARAREIQPLLVLEDPVHESVIDAGLGCMDVTETDPTESTEEQGSNALTKPDGTGKIIAQQQEGSEHGGSTLQSPAGGTDEGANANDSGNEKKRKNRSKNWTDEETEILLKVVPRKRKVKSRLAKGCGSEPWWEAIANDVPGRTGRECRMRMDTLTKSYKAIKEYCANHRKEFTELKEEDFRGMKLAKRKLATRLTESWYNRIRNHCPPRSNKKTGKEGAGSSLANGVPVLCASASGNSNSMSFSAVMYVCMQAFVPVLGRCRLMMLEHGVDYQVVHHLTQLQLYCQMAP